MNPIKITRFTSTNPDTLTKTVKLVDGKLKKNTVAQMVSGLAETVSFNTAQEFADLLDQAKENQAFCYGVPKNGKQKNKIVTQSTYDKLGNPNDCIPRANKHFDFADGPGVLMLDYDPLPDRKPLTKKEFVKIIQSVIPSLEKVSCLWRGSSSSHIYNKDTQEEIAGLKGQRLYILVKNAQDISRAGETLYQRLWLAGHGDVLVGVAGQFLERSIVDASVWQPNRLDFVGGANCIKPLVQRRAKTTVNEGELFDTEKELPDLTDGETSTYEEMVDASKRSKQAQSEKIKSEYVNREARSIAGPKADKKDLEEAQETVKRALDENVLEGPFIIHLMDRTPVTVQEILNDPEKYHKVKTLDPIEPSYDNYKQVGIIYTDGEEPVLYSQAHGGKQYRLTRHTITIEAGELSRTVVECCKTVAGFPFAFDMGNRFVVIQRERLFVHAQDSTSQFLGLSVRFQRIKRIKDDIIFIPIDPPQQLVKQFLAIDRGLRQLKGISHNPLITPSGRVIDKPGYDPETQLYFSINSSDWPQIPATPTVAQVREAVETLMDPFRLFPFTDDLSRTVLFSALLSAVVRSVLPTCPAYAFDANVFGSGKTLLANCIAYLYDNAKPSTTAPSDLKNDEETRKVLFAHALKGGKSLIIDNLMGTFNSASTAQFLTSENVEGRVLGVSRMESAPQKALLIYTGNNIGFKGDMTRRIITCRITPKEAKPYERKFDFDPLKYVIENRNEMVCAALTVISGWFSSDMKAIGWTPEGGIGSFEVWGEMIRNTTAWLEELHIGGIVDVKKAFDANIEVDPEQESMDEMFAGIYHHFGNEPFTAKELVRKIEYDMDGQIRDSIHDLAPTIRIGASSVGMFLKYRKDRIASGFRLKFGKNSQNTNVFWLENVPGSSASIPATTPPKPKIVNISPIKNTH